MSKRSIDEVDSNTVCVNLTPYVKVKKWGHLCGINTRFLNKEIDATYYHLGPTDPETEPLLPALIELNRRGIYTTDGQPGLIEEDTRQRAFIAFCVKDREKSNRVLAFLKTQPFVYYMYSTFDAKDSVVTNIPEDTRLIELTDEYHEDTKEWTTYTSRHVEWDLESELSDMDNVDRILKRAGFFFVCHRKFGVHESLEEMLLEFVNNNMKKDE